MSRGDFSAITSQVQRSCRTRICVFLASVLFVLFASVARAATTFEDISSQVSITRSGLILNRVTNTFDCLVQVTNTSSATLSGPLVLSVSSISTTNVNLFNPAGQDASGNPYVNLAVPTGGLASGQTIANSLLKFSNPNRVAFTFSIAVLSQAPSTNEGTTIQDSTGGTITVPDPDNPNAMVTIVIPPGDLGVPSDVISVSFSTTSPGPLSATGIAAGGHFVSRVVSLSRSSGLRFLLPVQVTIPYNPTQVGPDDSVLVFYWDATQDDYDVVATTGMDRTHGTITFQTVHFSEYQDVAFPISIGPSGLSTNPADLVGDTGFRAARDGFPIKNFDSMTGAADGGACLGLTAFSKWYFHSQTVRMANNPVFANGTSAQDDVDREVIYWAYDKTIQANQNTDWIGKQSLGDFGAANSLYLSLLVLDQPQLILLGLNGTYLSPASTHSVLVYNFSIDKANYIARFGFYDPNEPGKEQVLYYDISAQSFFMPPYTDVFGTQYSWVYFDAVSSFMTPIDFPGANTNANNGWPDRHFNEIDVDEVKSAGVSLVSPQGPDPVTSPAEYQVSPGAATLAMKWTCSCPPANANPPVSMVYAHVFVNGVFQEDVAIQPSPPGTPSPFSYSIPSTIFISPVLEPELIIIISDYPNGFFQSYPGVDPVDLVLSLGYEGFLRVKLAPPMYEVTELLDTYGVATSNYPMVGLGNGIPLQGTADRDQVDCEFPSTLASIYPGLNVYSIPPFSPTIPLVCAGYTHVSTLNLYVLPPILSNSFSASLGTASASANFNLQFNPTTISATASGSGLTSDPSQDDFTVGTGFSVSGVLSVPAAFQVTVSVPIVPPGCEAIAGFGGIDSFGNSYGFAAGQPPLYQQSVTGTGQFKGDFTRFGVSGTLRCTEGVTQSLPQSEISVSVTLIP